MEQSDNDTLEKGFVASAYVRRFREAKPTAPFEREGVIDRTLWWLSENTGTNDHNRSIEKSCISSNDINWGKLDRRQDSNGLNNIATDSCINQSLEGSNIYDAGLKVVERCNRLIQDYRSPAFSQQQHKINNSIERNGKRCISPFSSIGKSYGSTQDEFECNNKEDSSLFISPFSSVQTEEFPRQMFDLSEKQMRSNSGVDSSVKTDQRLLEQSIPFIEENHKSYENYSFGDNIYLNTQHSSVHFDHQARRVDETTIREFLRDPEVMRLWAQLLNIRACSASVRIELSHAS